MTLGGAGMVDDAGQVGRLLAKLQAALPVPVRLTPEVVEALQKEMAIEVPPSGSVDWVSYAGDEGGIVCRVDFGSELEKAVFASITHLRFDPPFALARDIVVYQKRRVKRLQRQPWYLT